VAVALGQSGLVGLAVQVVDALLHQLAVEGPGVHRHATSHYEQLFMNSCSC
jgi:hypothetical protein